MFLSGNGPLVKVVQEALVRDAARGSGRTKKEVRREVSTFIQNVHRFIHEYIIDHAEQHPVEHIILFDEAQRAWNAQQVNKKKKLGKIGKSEPDLMLEIMERCPRWCVLVALVGGGQEIHDGEAGLEEWGRALSRRSEVWQVWLSPEALSGDASVAGHRLFDGPAPQSCHIGEMSSLHLRVSVRSFRAQRIAEWVNRLLSLDAKSARELLSDVSEFPVVMTRDLGSARRWLCDRSRLDRRCGLLASSGSVRHRAYGIEVSTAFRQAYKFTDWFLAGPDDVRSSYRLEVAATEFECQGLELDWVGLCWGDDFCIDPAQGRWLYRRFQPQHSRWANIRGEVGKQYLANKYRVLLTRAREGMVIWIPPGDQADRTRDPILLDATADYLAAAGVQPL